MPAEDRAGHLHRHAFASFHGREREGLVVAGRRNFLKASLAGIAGMTVPDLLRWRAEALAARQGRSSGKSVILLWMAGGPSHIDTWDPKPDRPASNRGPFKPIATRQPGVRICEHLPRQAAMFDKFTLIRSVDARGSNHEPNMVMQSGFTDNEPRTNPRAHRYPCIGSMVAKHHGANYSSMPAYAAFMTGRSHIGFAGDLGKAYDPFLTNTAARLPIYTNVGVDTGRMSSANLFTLAGGLSTHRILARRGLLDAFDSLRNDLDRSGVMESMDRYGQQAVQMVLGDRARQAFALEQEPRSIRERYGKHLWCQQALLARRLVEAGVAYVTIDLSYHPASGTWDNHGDNIPPYGGILHGLRPLLPLFDHLLTTLVSDLDERGMLGDVLVIAMGEFGRTPNMGTQGSTDGRNHWPVVMSMCLAGGGFHHGQVIGATEKDGGNIKDRPVTPGDLAATIYHHMGVPLDTTYVDHNQRPRYVVENGNPIRELL